MKTPFRMNVLELKGTPREIGRGHGEALRDEIARRLDIQRAGLFRRNGLKEEDLLNTVFNETGLLQTARKWAPELVEEIEGLAEGARLDFRLAFAIQLLDELGWLMALKQLDYSSLDESNCSTIGVPGNRNGVTVLAQNADMGKAVDGFGTILKITNTQSGCRSIIVTVPGVIGIYGLNDCAVGVCLNAMSLRLKKSTTGLGTIFVSRKILDQKSLSEASKFLSRVPHASGETYTVGGPGEIAAFECSPNSVRRFFPFGDMGPVYHTNHPLVNDDTEQIEEKFTNLPEEIVWQIRNGDQNTRIRAESLAQRLGDLSSGFGVETAKQVLSAHDSTKHPVCRHKRRDIDAMTNFCIIMELGRYPCMHVSSGPPCSSTFETFTF